MSAPGYRLSTDHHGHAINGIELFAIRQSRNRGQCWPDLSRNDYLSGWPFQFLHHTALEILHAPALFHKRVSPRVSGRLKPTNGGDKCRKGTAYRVAGFLGVEPRLVNLRWLDLVIPRRWKVWRRGIVAPDVRRTPVQKPSANKGAQPSACLIRRHCAHDRLFHACAYRWVAYGHGSE